MKHCAPGLRVQGPLGWPRCSSNTSATLEAPTATHLLKHCPQKRIDMRDAGSPPPSAASHSDLRSCLQAKAPGRPSSNEGGLKLRAPSKLEAKETVPHTGCKCIDANSFENVTH